MTKSSEGDKKMPTLTKNDLEKRVSKNTKRYKKAISRVQSDIQSKNFTRGRVRPRDPKEANILSRFKQGQSNDEY